MRRRQFIAGLGAAERCRSPRAAQQRRSAARIWCPPDWQIRNRFWSEFRARTAWSTATSKAKTLRSSSARPTASSIFCAELAEELVRLKVDIIVGVGRNASRHCGNAGDNGRSRSSWRRRRDPVQTGLIGGLARPGGNITGLSGTAAELGAKTLELLRDMLPSTRGRWWPSWPLPTIHSPGLSSNKSSKAAGRPEHRNPNGHGSAAWRNSPAAFAAMGKRAGRMPSWCRGVSRANRFSSLALKHRLPAVGGGAGGRLFHQGGRPDVLLRQPKRHVPSCWRSTSTAS